MGRGSWGFWAMGASQRKDVRPKVRLLFPSWPEASRFTRKLGSYQHRTGWCGAADGASWRLIVTDTNGAVPSHCGCRGWRLRAVVEETVRLSRRGAELKLTCVSLKGELIKAKQTLLRPYSDQSYIKKTQLFLCSSLNLEYGWGTHFWTLVIGSTSPGKKKSFFKNE